MAQSESFLPFDKVDHDVPGGWALDLGVNVVPGKSRTDQRLDAGLARLVKVAVVRRSQRRKQGVLRAVVAAVWKEMG